jgi:hypothetical protein
VYPLISREHFLRSAADGRFAEKPPKNLKEKQRVKGNQNRHSWQKRNLSKIAKIKHYKIGLSTIRWTRVLVTIPKQREKGAYNSL